MRNRLILLAATSTIIALGVCASSARDLGNGESVGTEMLRLGSGPVRPSERSGARLETLWIFDADFEDLSGANAGWTAWDRSGTLGSINYWHHDTIRINGFTHLGDSTWWCGTSNPCWRQPRGYGNDWLQILERSFTEASALAGGTPLFLEYDQRFAMENDYDYGYTEISTDGGATWVELWEQCNPGFAGQPGTSQDWNSTHFEGGGHIVLDLTAYAGTSFDLRYRFTSDYGYSSQDQYNNPPYNSCLDGAWQLDNIRLYAFDPDSTVLYYDDAESNGDNGWIHEDTYPSGQMGITFWRGQFGVHFVTGRSFTCDDRPVGSWMYAAVDPFTSTMVDDQDSWLMSPPIDISGAARLVGQWDQWVDLPRPTGDVFNLQLASNDAYECVTDPAGFVDEAPGAWYGGPFWGVWTDDWDAFAGNDWLAIRWDLWNAEPPAEPHMAGIFCNRQRVGIPSGEPGTIFEQKEWDAFHDWFHDDLPDALVDSARVWITDHDDIASALLMASDNGGQTWEAYECVRENPADDWWLAPPPANQMMRGSEILYYYEATDGVGNTSTCPGGAPDETFEMSILPITASTSDPGLLLVDDHGRVTAGEARDSLRYSEYYYREALDILGYDCDVYDVESPTNTNPRYYGPDTTGMKYYDTLIWFTSDVTDATIWPIDQRCLIEWLNQSAEGKERNLLLTGNDIGYHLVESGMETLAFYEAWLASSYLGNTVGLVTVDSVPGLVDRAGGFDFMTSGDGECILRGGCPTLHNFDVVDAGSGIVGNEVAADYERENLTTAPAGVAYTHATLGYQTVNLGFGIEFMMDGTNPDNPGNYSPEGYYHTGLVDRVDLLQNILDYFGKAPGGAPTGLAEEGPKNSLSQACPNPFNPVTRIEYAIKDAGPVKIEVCNVAGKVVTVLFDAEVGAGASGLVVWDGTNDRGEHCASGVYFYRLDSPGFTASRKMVMLR